MCLRRRHPLLDVVGRDAEHHQALVRPARTDGRETVALRIGGFREIQPQFRLACRRVRAVAQVAVVREDGLDVKVVVDLTERVDLFVDGRRRRVGRTGRQAQGEGEYERKGGRSGTHHRLIITGCYTIRDFTVGFKAAIPVGPSSLVSGPWSLVSGPWSLVSGPWSLVIRRRWANAVRPYSALGIRHSSLVPRHSSLVTRHSAFVTRPSPLVPGHSSLGIRHSSLATRPRSLVTRHSSLVTRPSPLVPPLPAQV